MQIGWIDFSQQDRERTLTILDALQEPGSVDELGVGIVRDAMAARLFPGTSTLLTKARYFFLVPYLMRQMEQGRDGARRPPRDLRDEYQALERRCAEGLLACEANREGIIGRVSLPQGRWVSRGPGEIYWASIRALGFMRDPSPESYSAYFRYLADVRTRDDSLQFEGDSDKSGLSDDAEPVASAWRIPADCLDSWRQEWEDWGNRARIALTKHEAAFLRKQVLSTQPDSLFAQLLDDDALRQVALGVREGGPNDSNAKQDSSFHGFLEAAGIAAIERGNREIAHLCALGDAFSEFVLGCRIAYNMQLAGQETAGGQAWEYFEPRAQRVAARLDIDAVGIALGLTGHGGFLSLREFILHAQEAMYAGDVYTLKALVAARERYLKGARSKIGRSDLGELSWRGGLRLSYRFEYATSIIREIDEAGGFDA